MFNETAAYSAIMLYDETKSKITGARLNVKESNKGNQFITFMTPVNAKYIRISSEYSTWKYVYLSKGISYKMNNNRSLKARYTPDYDIVKQIVRQDISTAKENILNRGLFKCAGVVASQDVTRTDSDWLCTDYIALDPNKSNVSHEYCRFVAYFDENKNFLAYSDNQTEGFWANCSFSGALSYYGDNPTRIRPKYIRVTAHINDLDYVRMWYGEQITTIKADASLNPIYTTPDPQTPHFNDSLVNLLNELNVTYSTGTVSNTGETITDAKDWMSSNLIDTKDLPTHLYLKNVRIVAQYDENMKFISSGYKLIGGRWYRIIGF